MRIVFFGNAEFGIPSLEKLAHSSHQVAAVVTNPDKPMGRGQVLSPTTVKRKALSLRLPVLEAQDLNANEFYEKLKAYSADLFLVIAYRILPERIFSLPPEGMVNLHASLLPKYRGPAPIRWALINGEKKTGVTTFFIEKKVDTGGILLQRETEIGPRENYGELYRKLSELGADAVTETVDLIARGEAKPKPQDSGQVSLAPKISRELGEVDWRQSAGKIFDLIRGLSPEPGAFTYYQGKVLRILKAEVESAGSTKAEAGEVTATGPKEGFRVRTGEGELSLITLQLEGKKILSAEEFLRGQRLKAGEKLGK